MNKAGRILRRWARGELVAVDEHRDALATLLDHRAARRQPLTKATMGLRSVVKTEQCQIEVQIRTQVMHAWAITVERLGGRLGEDLKCGYGPQPVLALLEGTAEAMAIEEEGGVVGKEALDRLSESRQAAAPFLGGGHR